MITTISDKGTAFLIAHEGFVSKAYRDPVGIITIGTGFTNRSKIARRMLGPIKMGMRITKEMNSRVLKEAVAKEYGPPVVRGLPGAVQHEFDAGVSVSFNCGGGALKWVWAQKWRAGDKVGAAHRLRTTATKARGRRLAGLVRRRKEEANLLLNGDYGHYGLSKARAKVKSNPQVREAQALLNKHGYGPLGVDGIAGPKTAAVVLKFQKSHPDIINDGKIGAATIAQLRRRHLARAESETMAVPAAGGGIIAGIVAILTGGFAQWAAVIAVGLFAVVAGYVILMNWTEIRHWYNEKRGRVIE